MRSEQEPVAATPCESHLPEYRAWSSGLLERVSLPCLQLSDRLAGWLISICRTSSPFDASFWLCESGNFLLLKLLGLAGHEDIQSIRTKDALLVMSRGHTMRLNMPNSRCTTEMAAMAAFWRIITPDLFHATCRKSTGG